MKRIIPLFISIIILSSCSSDDNNSNTFDPIVGKWMYDKITYFYENGEINEFELNTCDKQSYLEFYNSNSVKTVAYSLSSGNCQIVIDGNGWELNEFISWIKTNGQYLVNFEDGSNAELEIINNRIKIKFQLNIDSIQTTVLQEYIKE